MSYFTSESVSITTAADGSATAYTVGSFNGNLQAIRYVPDGSTPFADSVVITVTAETSGIPIWAETLGTASAALNRYPRAATHSIAGVASLYAAAGQAVTDRIPLIGERIKVVVASGGNAKISALRFVVGG